MDKLLYISMSGAKENMNAVAVRANNLANANTTG
ncbi:MAG: flagellar biosynthesis protein FlgF, partial [Psychrobium sp.]|nr:flagellar biosynthesis protein FlgF [Psychrobium sp.]